MNRNYARTEGRLFSSRRRQRKFFRRSRGGTFVRFLRQWYGPPPHFAPVSIPLMPRAEIERLFGPSTYTTHRPPYKGE